MCDLAPPSLHDVQTYLVPVEPFWMLSARTVCGTSPGLYVNVKVFVWSEPLSTLNVRPGGFVCIVTLTGGLAKFAVSVTGPPRVIVCGLMIPV